MSWRMAGKRFTKRHSCARTCRPGRSARQWIRAGRGHQMLGHPVGDVMESFKPAALILDPRAQGVSIELHVGEILHQDVDRFDRLALELLASQDRAMLTRERIEAIPDDDPEVLKAHLVHALVDRRDELDVLNHLAVEDLERLAEHD